jgi:membrane protein
MADSPMKKFWNVLLEVFNKFMEDRCTQLAAALAYYTVFSIPPLLIIIITVCGYVWDPDNVQTFIFRELKDMIGPQASEQIQNMMEYAHKPGQGTWKMILGVTVLFFGATGAVAQMQMALNQIWKIKADPEEWGIMTLVVKRLLSFAMALGLAFMLLVSTVLSSVISAFSDLIGGWLGESELVLFLMQMGTELVIFTLLIGGIFQFMPDARIRWRDVWMGSLVTAVLFILGKSVIGFYLGSKESITAYGVAGNFIIVLLWIYYSSMILFLGAEFTQVWTHEYGKSIRPKSGSVKFIEKIMPKEMQKERKKEKRQEE